jgi:hypothetical protein
MQQLTFRTSAEHSQYALERSVDPGDGPSHIVRIYDVHRTFPSNPPVAAGLKIVGGSERGIADDTDGNGNNTYYSVYPVEHGDNFFIRSSLVFQSAEGKLTGMSSEAITGGTGKLAGIHGIPWFRQLRSEDRIQ